MTTSDTLVTETVADPEVAETKYSRVLLKISGEALMGDQGFGLHPPTVQRIAEEVIVGGSDRRTGGVS